ncbi:MAG TPA: MoaD/ThiS family protein [Panacibacter sp.]|nr:MoaD/ThiS family protein [Panacibacter sp.]
MKITILAFGIAKEIFSSSVIEIELPDANVDALKRLLEEKYPGLKQLSSYMVALNNEYAQAGDTINAGDEVAVIPPVSGG